MHARTESVLATLRGCPALARVDADGLRLLAEMGDEERYETGEVVVAKGERAERVAIVATGRLSVHVDDRAEATRVLEPGALFGEYGMFAGGVRTATVRAVEPTVLHSFPYDRFRAFLTSFPQALLVLMEQAVRRLRDCEARLEARRE